jgi:hypothetical protein
MTLVMKLLMALLMKPLMPPRLQQQLGKIVELAAIPQRHPQCRQLVSQRLRLLEVGAILQSPANSTVKMAVQAISINLFDGL